MKKYAPAKKLTSIEQIHNIIACGVYFGYSTESIIEFLTDFNKCSDPNTDEFSRNRFRTRNIFGNGHIVATSEIGIPSAVLSAAIEVRRFCKTEFALSADLSVSSCSDEINALLAERDNEFNHRVNCIKNVVYPMYDLILIR